MSITNIEIIHNEELPKTKPIKEIMSIRIPDIIDGIPNRNGSIWLVSGSGGSGKTNLLLSMFKSKGLYKNKFSNIWLIVPESSFTSVEKHPFIGHDRIYHELTAELLESIFKQLCAIKEESMEDDEFQYNCVIIDDFANVLKDKNIQIQLNKMLIKARHLCTCFIFLIQSYYYFPKQLRKQITNFTCFKPKSYAEWETICKEVFDMTKVDALTLFHYVYDEAYAHLDVDTVENIYYKNFHRLVIHTTNDIEKL